MLFQPHYLFCSSNTFLRRTFTLVVSYSWFFPPNIHMDLSFTSFRTLLKEFSFLIILCKILSSAPFTVSLFFLYYSTFYLLVLSPLDCKLHERNDFVLFTPVSLALDCVWHVGDSIQYILGKLMNSLNCF